MGGALLYMLRHPELVQERISYGRFVEVLVFIAVGAAVYGVAAILFGAVRPSDLKGMRRGSAT